MIDFIINIDKAHPVLIALGAYWIFSAAVSGMPTPRNGSMFYMWLYSFLHTLAGSVGRAVAAKYPDFFKQAPETK